jgi:hypothetical protein
MHITDDIIPAMELDGIEADPSSFLNCPHFEAATVTFQVCPLTGHECGKHTDAQITGSLVFWLVWQAALRRY